MPRAQSNGKGSDTEAADPPLNSQTMAMPAKLSQSLYRRLYAAPHTEALSAYTRGMMAEIQRLKQQYDLISRGEGQRGRNRSPEQMSLWPPSGVQGDSRPGA